MSKKYIIFDFDGTIADNAQELITEMRRIAKEELGLDFTDEQMKDVKSMSPREVLKRYHISLIKIPAFTAEMKKAILKLESEIKIRDGMKELLSELSQYYVLGILSSNSKQVINRFLERNSIVKYFDFVEECSNLFGKNVKMRRIMRLRKLTNQDLVYVGDELRDISAMRILNIKVISVSWGLNSIEALESANPGLVAKSVPDLKRLLI